MCDATYYEDPETTRARRELLRAEFRREEDARIIDGLLARLTPEDGARSLFTNDERKFWDIPGYRKRRDD